IVPRFAMPKGQARPPITVAPHSRNRLRDRHPIPPSPAPTIFQPCVRDIPTLWLYSAVFPQLERPEFLLDLRFLDIGEYPVGLSRVPNRRAQCHSRQNTSPHP